MKTDPQARGEHVGFLRYRYQLNFFVMAVASMKDSSRQAVEVSARGLALCVPAGLVHAVKFAMRASRNCCARELWSCKILSHRISRFL